MANVDDDDLWLCLAGVSSIAHAGNAALSGLSGEIKQQFNEPGSLERSFWDPLYSMLAFA
jgi:hypothetical protein